MLTILKVNTYQATQFTIFIFFHAVHTHVTNEIFLYLKCPAGSKHFFADAVVTFCIVYVQ